MPALHHRPPAAAATCWTDAGRRPPLHLSFHGGAFITRVPADEGNVARYLASELGCHVLCPDYLAAPQVRHPVAEEQAADALRWAGATDPIVHRPWDPRVVSIGGSSAGAQLALVATLDVIDHGGPRPVAVSLEFPPADLERTAEQYERDGS